MKALSGPGRVVVIVQLKAYDGERDRPCLRAGDTARDLDAVIGSLLSTGVMGRRLTSRWRSSLMPGGDADDASDADAECESNCRS